MMVQISCSNSFAGCQRLNGGTCFVQFVKASSFPWPPLAIYTLASGTGGTVHYGLGKSLRSKTAFIICICFNRGGINAKVGG